MRRSAGNILAAALLAAFMARTTEAKTLVIANFNDGADPMNVNAASNVTDVTANISHVYVTTSPHGGNGRCLQINHTAAAAGWCQLNFGATVDISSNAANPMTGLSFWVRGAAGGEFFSIDLRSQSLGEPGGADRIRIKDFLPGGITTAWQKVVIPVKALTKGLDQTCLTDVNGVILDFAEDSPGVQTLYIDDISLVSKTAPVVIDMFEDGTSPNGLRELNDYTNDGTGGTTARGLIVSTQSSGGSYSIQAITEIGVAPDWGAGLEFRMRDYNAGGKFVDIGPNTNRLSFALKKEPGTTLENLKIEFWDNAGADAVFSGTYSAVTNSWQTYSIPLSAFPSRDLTRAARFHFIFDVANSTAIFYMDDVKIVDVTTPTAPSGFLRSGVAAANGMMFTSTDVLTVTADAAGTDTTLERVRFEHDNLSGGASWYVIGVDTDTADAAYSTNWPGFASLVPGTSYQMRVVAEDVSGNEGRTSVYTGISLPLVNGSTSFSGTALSATSIRWTWTDNASNEGGYRVYSSTGGQVSPEVAGTTWDETGLSTNTQYTRYVRPFLGGAVYTAGANVARYTASLPVPSLSVLDRNGSFATIVWSTGTGGNAQFQIGRSASGISGAYLVLSTVTGATFSYQDTGLDPRTTYWYTVTGYNGDLVPTALSAAATAQVGLGVTIIHTPPSSILVPPGSAQDVTIQASVSAGTPVQGITLQYRKIGDTVFTSTGFAPALDLVSSTYSGSAVIPAAFVTLSVSSGGFEYRIISSDTVKTATNPVSGVNTVSVSETFTAPAVGAAGGTVTVDDGDPSHGKTSLVIPAGALSGNTSVTVKQLDAAALPKQNGVAPASAYEFGPSGLAFSRPITMTLLYPDRDGNGFVDGTSIDESTLKLCWYDGFAWRNLGGTVDASANTVTAKVSHFSTFGTLPASPSSDDDVRPKEKIITPNGDGINDSAQFGASGDFEISIYSPLGHKIRSLKNLSSWDGRRDDGNVADSGVYVYQVRANGKTISGTIGVAK